MKYSDQEGDALERECARLNKELAETKAKLEELRAEYRSCTQLKNPAEQAVLDAISALEDWQFDFLKTAAAAQDEFDRRWLVVAKTELARRETAKGDSK